MTPSSDRLLKYASLAIVVPHSITYTILGAECRKPDANGNVFFGPSAVVMMEIGKLAISLIGVALTVSRTRPGSAVRIAGSKGHDESDYVLIPSQPDSPYVDQYSPSASKEVRVMLNEGYQARRHSNVVIKAKGSDRLQWLVRRMQTEVVTAKAFALCIPAFLYAMQNNLQIFAAGFLSGSLLSH